MFPLGTSRPHLVSNISGNFDLPNWFRTRGLIDRRHRYQRQQVVGELVTVAYYVESTPVAVGRHSHGEPPENGVEVLHTVSL